MNELPSPEELADTAQAELVVLSARLQAARKILRRDWAHLSPRERSEQSRLVRELELGQAALVDQIEMNRLG